MSKKAIEARPLDYSDCIFKLNGSQIRNARKMLNTESVPAWMILPDKLRDPIKILDAEYNLIGTLTGAQAYKL